MPARLQANEDNVVLKSALQGTLDKLQVTREELHATRSELHVTLEQANLLLDEREAATCFLQVSSENLLGPPEEEEEREAEAGQSCRSAAAASTGGGSVRKTLSVELSSNDDDLSSNQEWKLGRVTGEPGTPDTSHHEHAAPASCRG